MKYCINCGAKLPDNARFCTNCGEEISSKKINIEQETLMQKISIIPTEIEKINKKIELKNNQTSIVRNSWYVAGFFALVIILTFSEIIEIHPAIVMISIFFFIVSLIIGFMFRSRERKLQKLISGENLIAQWTLTAEQKKQYVKHLFTQEVGKNQIILFVISFISIIVFGLFILFIDEGKLAMLGVLVGLIVFLALFAYGMPYYYRFKNNKGDSQILIGAKYAYVNGYFHNWDFPLSGITKVKIIKEPFYGLKLVYYYTDRTLSHSEELVIPANTDVDLKELIRNLKSLNKK